MTIAIADAVDAYIDRKAVGDPASGGAGTYVRNATSILQRWVDWLEREHDLVALSGLEEAHLAAYAETLAERTDRGEYTASTARTYFAVVRAFLSWCRDGGLIEENPAAAGALRDLLPPPADTAAPLSRADRRELERHVRRRALEADPADRLGRLREYAIVAVLAHAGVRGAELFRVPEDDRRTGARWADVDFYAGTIRVLGTSQRLEEVPLAAGARTPLRRYRTVLDPPTNDWPLFPTRHAPSIAGAVRAALRERGLDAAAVDRALSGTTALAVARDRGIAPPAITTEGARSILGRLCEEADIDLEGGSLTPRGVRLGSPSPDRTRASPPRPVLRTTADQSMAVPEPDDRGPR